MNKNKNELDELFWSINEQAKREGEGSSFRQFKSLKAILEQYDDVTVEALGDIERSYRRAFQRNPEYDLLHARKGGFVRSGDDGFYMDFGSWLVAQGKDLFDDFQQEGHEAVVRYVCEGGFDEDDYRFESMCYAYQRL